MTAPGGVERGEGTDAERRAAVYCLIPRDLASKLEDPLRDHFAEWPDIEVVTERRGHERRRAGERRASPAPSQWGEPPAGIEERRRIRNAGGRRVGDRRAPLVPLEAEAVPELPRRARRHADRLAFAGCLRPSTQDVEDQDSARLVTRFQAGDRDAFTTLYTRYFNRVYSYLRTVLRDTHEAEDATQQVFTQVFEALSRYEHRGQPFRAWLFTLGRNQSVSTLRKQGRLTLEDAEELERRRELDPEAAEAPPALDWLSDRDLMVFVERLPLPQRQVLLLRYGLGFSNKQIGQILERDPMAIARLHHRSMTFLRERLTAIGRTSGTRDRRAECRRPLTQVAVLRARRFALSSRL